MSNQGFTMPDMGAYISNSNIGQPPLKVDSKPYEKSNFSEFFSF